MSRANRPTAFRCPRCGGPTRVAYTRGVSSQIIRRGRACRSAKCGTAFVTEERPARNQG